jgi:hypothetical protein
MGSTIAYGVTAFFTPSAIQWLIAQIAVAGPEADVAAIILSFLGTIGIALVGAAVLFTLVSAFYAVLKSCQQELGIC